MSKGTIFGLSRLSRNVFWCCPARVARSRCTCSMARPTRPRSTRSDHGRARSSTVFTSVAGVGLGVPALRTPSSSSRRSVASSLRSVSINHYVIEVAFRLIPLENGMQTAEIVAVSYDGGKTFYENKLCTLPREYAQLEKVQAG
jgi:hypothetical protein